MDDNGHMYLMVILMDKNRALNIDYIQVTFVGPEVWCGQPTPTPTPTATSRYSKSPYPFGDATMDGTVDISDYAEVEAIILETKPKSSSSDATMDGDTDISDCAEIWAMVQGVKTPSDRYVASYDFNTGGAGTIDLAAYKQTANVPSVVWPADSGWTDFTAGDYTNVEAIDASYFSMSASASSYNTVQCRFTVFEHICAPSLTHIEINVTASSQYMSDTLQYWAWDFSSGQWDQVGGSITMSSGVSSYYMVTDWGPPNVDNYMDDNGHMYLMVILMDKNRALNIDYIQVTFVGPEVWCGQPTPTPTPTATNNEHHTNVNRLGNGNGHRDLHGISYTYCITVTYTNV